MKQHLRDLIFETLESEDFENRVEITEILLPEIRDWALEMIKVYPEKFQPFYQKQPEDQEGINIMDSFYAGTNGVRVMAGEKIKESTE